MTPAQAILVGAILISASILFVSVMRPAEAQHVGPFQLMHHSNPQANAGVFRLDTSSGDVSYCYISGAGALSCTKER